MFRHWKFIGLLLLLIALCSGCFFWIKAEKEQRLKTYLEPEIIAFDKELTIRGSGNLIYAMPKVTSSKIGKAITDVVKNENREFATIVYPEKLSNPLIGEKAYCVTKQNYQPGLGSDKYVSKVSSHYLYLTEKGQKLTLEDIVIDKSLFSEIVIDMWKSHKHTQKTLDRFDEDDWSKIEFFIDNDALIIGRSGEPALPIGFWQIIKAIDHDLFSAEKIAEYEEFYNSFNNGTGVTIHYGN